MPYLPGSYVLDRKIIEGIGYTINSLSLVGCCFVWISILRFRKKLVGAAFSKPYQFIFFQTLTGFLMAVHALYTIAEGTIPPLPAGNFTPFTNVSHTPTMTPACVFMGIFGHFSVLSTLSWNLVIIFQIVYILMGKAFGSHSKKITIAAHVYVWTFSFVTSTVPYFMNTYTTTSMGCWIDEDHEITLFLSFSAPILLYLLLAIGVSFSVYLHRNRVRQEYVYVHALGNPLEVAQYPEISLLLSFTFVFIICWIIPFILHLVEVDIIPANETTTIWLTYVSLVTSGAQGLICSFIWGFSDFFRYLLNERNRKTLEDPPLQDSWLDFIKTSVPKEMIEF